MAFHLYKSPLAVNKSYDLTRRIMNPAYLWFYQHFVEKSYTKEGFFAGAKQCATLVATLLREQRFDRLNQYMTTASAKQLRLRSAEFSADQIDKYFNFTDEDIVKVIHHSSFVSSQFLFDRSNESLDFTFYTTFVMYVDKMDHSDRTVSQLLKSRNDMLICNLTVARLLLPLGRWRITDVNFFNTTFVNSSEETQLITMI